jgi:hypothetical protein
MPIVTVKSGIPGPDGHEEQISEYFCDSRDCPNIATRVLGCVKELRLRVVVCEEHAAKLGFST